MAAEWVVRDQVVNAPVVYRQCMVNELQLKTNNGDI